uniref:Toxin candidate TRINITY_DN22076_c7_g21_i4 n=1 Tax=Ceriantheomorphe brasiliensis TaxID=1048506 RepID=A0A7G7WZ53_9CNID|nr:toxin candidate TRINITY_DN22076_c7_g21_i4 [Ceriantheomorphe brasiliensis]
MAKFRLLPLLGFFLAVRSIGASGVNQKPYFTPMILGRTFDISKNEVGNDIFNKNARARQKTIRVDSTTIKFKTINDNSDVNDVLDVSGELALQIKGGLVNVEGSGSYVKENRDATNFVEVLAKVKTITKTKTLTSDITPMDRFYNRKLVGKHYVRSITYGGILIASLRFTAKRGKSKEHIKARVEGNLKAATVQVGLAGQFEKLASKVEDLSDLSIKYYSTAPLKTVPLDVKTMIKAIEEFPTQLKTVNNGDGIPLSVNLQEISTLDVPHRNLDYLDNRMLRARLGDLDHLYTDLLETDDAIKYWLKNTVTLGSINNNEVQKFYSDLTDIISAFDTAVAGIDLSCSANQECNDQQLQKAFEKYKGDGNIIPGKYKRQFNRIKWKIELSESAKTEVRTLLQTEKDKIRGQIRRYEERLNRVMPAGESVTSDLDKTVTNFKKVLPGIYFLAYQTDGQIFYPAYAVSFSNVKDTSSNQIGQFNQNGELTIQDTGLYLITYYIAVIERSGKPRENVKVQLKRKTLLGTSWEVLSQSMVLYSEKCFKCDQALSDTVVLKLNEGDRIMIENNGPKRIFSYSKNYFSLVLLRKTD